jgi:acylglycerol lipase
MADLHSVLLSQLPCPVPLFLLGHSMGGATMFTYACMGSSSVLSQISGFIGEAPDFGFPADAPAKPHRLTVVAGKIAKNFVPGLQVVQQLDATTLSRVVEEQKKYLDDPLCHDTVTLEGVSGHFDRVRSLVRHNVTLSKEVKSVWIGYGTKDRCTSYIAGKAWLEDLDLQDKEFRSYEGALHSCKLYLK